MKLQPISEDFTIQGNSAEATEALSLITGALAGRPASSAASVDFNSTGVSSVGQFDQPSFATSGAETRADIAATFEACPSGILESANRLGELNGFSKRDRILRAWTAGCWARAVLEQRVQSPCRSVQLPIRSRYYVVLRAEGVDSPVIYQSCASYWRALRGALGESVTHSFPSEAEARAYARAAGFLEPLQLLP